VATYLAALAAFRAVLRFGNPLPRLVAAVAALATIPVGTAFGVAQQLLTLAALVVVLLLVEHRIAAPARADGPDQAG